MPFEFVCPNCNTPTLVPDEYEGRSGPCAHCGQWVTVERPVARRRASELSEAPTPTAVRLLLGLLAAFAIFVLLTGWLFLQYHNRRPPGSPSTAHVTCSRNLSRIGLALQAYHDTYSCYPPAVTYDAQGREMHSWRVLLLPFLADGTLDALYSSYHMDKPWDAPENLELSKVVPDVYVSELDPNASAMQHTSYLAITGKGTAFPDSHSSTRGEFSDPASDIILVAEPTRSGVVWTQPIDLGVTRMQFGVNRETGRSMRTEHGGGPHVLMADGTVRRLKQDAPAQFVQAMTTVAGNERVAWELVADE